MVGMRIALVSPYSWTYPGGVTRHIEALAGELSTAGHDIRVLAPFDPDDDLSRRLHMGARPQARQLPEYLIPVGRSVGVRSNGSVSNVAVTTSSIARTRSALKAENFDVIHVHEPAVPTVSWDIVRSASSPLVGTFHTYSTSRSANYIANFCGARRGFNKLSERIAVSEAAAWTAKRFYGGQYTVLPNGVHIPDSVSDAFKAEAGRSLKLLFIGPAVERKGLPVLLRAVSALQEHLPVKLTVVGSEAAQLPSVLLEDVEVQFLGKVSESEKQRQLERADILCAPSLGGESFGMVLTEAFAHGKPVVASNIAGYRDVVRDGKDGVLVPVGDATALAEALRDLWHEPERLKSYSVSAAERAQTFAWPKVAQEVTKVYEKATAETPHYEGLKQVAFSRGFVPQPSSKQLQKSEALPKSLEPPEVLARARSTKIRRAALGSLAVIAFMLSFLAVTNIGLDRISDSFLSSSPTWVIAALVTMCFSMFLRAVAWHSMLKAALPKVQTKLADALQGTAIGVFMSATLPARLGEPSRALVVARRLGRVRDLLPTVLGTVLSQTVVNLAALMVLGVGVLTSIDLFTGRERFLLYVAAAPALIVALLTVVPVLVKKTNVSRSARLHSWIDQARKALESARGGLAIFKHPKLGITAVLSQFAAWGVQLFAFYLLLVAFGLHSQAGLGAAAVVLFAVNVTAILPATPSNIGVFQAACVAVLAGVYGVSSADALGYGIVLQAVEMATAFAMGMPALVKEGLSWSEIRMRALHSTPVMISPRRGSSAESLEAEL